MNIEAEKLKKLLLHIITSFRRMEHELLAHALLVVGLKKTMGMDRELDALLEEARNSPEVKKQLQEKYDEPLAKFLANIDEAELNQQILEFLEKWQPKAGPPN